MYTVLMHLLFGFTVNSIISGGHYSKESGRGGGHDLHNFISSGFVTLGRGHAKGNAVLSCTNGQSPNTLDSLKYIMKDIWAFFFFNAYWSVVHSSSSTEKCY